MSRYHVQVKEGVFQHVDADEFLVKSACLVFQDEGMIKLVLAPGQWMTCHEEESGRTALKLVNNGSWEAQVSDR